MQEDSDVLRQAIRWIQDGHGVALATVMSTWGSSPRPVGALLAVNDKGAFVGSVSGGCIEPFVVSEAIEVIASGEVRDLEYGVTDKQAEQIRLSCGGTIRVFVERAPRLHLLQTMAGAEAVTRVINPQNGQALSLDKHGVIGSLTLDKDLLDEVHCLHKQGANGTMIPNGDAELFVASYLGPKRLIIVGAVHISEKLVVMAKALGFDVTVIEPRPAFTKPQWLAQINLIQDRTQRAIESVVLDSQTAVALLAHDPMIDDPVLHAALCSEAYYIGCLGSRRTHAKRVERLRSAGFKPATIDRIHGPIGLNIGGRSSGEIAVSILAEIIAVEHGKIPQE